MSESDAADPRKSLSRLKEKADFQTTAHAKLRDEYRFADSIWTMVSLVSGVILLTFVVATPGFINETLGIPARYYQWLITILAILEFSIVIVLLAWRPDVRAEQHERAAVHYTKAATEMGNTLKRDSEVTTTTVEHLRGKYLEDTDLPRIPEHSFLRLKQWHLRKLAVSRELDIHPHESLRSIKRRLKHRDISATKSTEIPSEDG